MASRRLRKSKTQTRLGFTPIPSSSPSGHEARVSIDVASTPRKKRRLDDSKRVALNRFSPDLEQAINASKHENLRVVVGSSKGKSVQLPTPEPSSQIDQVEKTDSRRRNRERFIAQKPIHGIDTRSSDATSSNSSAAESDAEDPKYTITSTKKTPVTLDSSSSESDVMSPAARNVRKARRAIPTSSPPETPSKPTSSRAPVARNFLAGGTTGNAPLSRSQRIVSRFSQPKKGYHGSSSTESDEDLAIKPTKGSRASSNQRPRVQRSADSEAEEEGSDEILTTPVRRRVSRRQSQEQSENDDSMLEELADAEDEDEVQGRRPRDRRGNKLQNKRLEDLAKLKNRRAGVLGVSDSEEDQGHGRAEENSHIEDESFDEEITGEKEQRNENLDEYESDFVEDDGEIGVDLMKYGVPLEFTGHANKKLFDYFRDEIEWMVHNKLDPAFERYDEIYELANRKLNDEVIGLAGSEFKSSIWKPKFIKALQSRPDLYTTLVGADSIEPKCEACNRSKHPPKWMITFSGPTYDTKSLERLSSKHDSESDSSSSDDNGEEKEEEEKEERWHVGSVCCGNAEVAHTLYHWRFQLNATVLSWLSANGHTSPAKILDRENWSRRKREKLANKVVDGMVETGEMKSLYKQFRQNLDAARAARDERIQR